MKVPRSSATTLSRRANHPRATVQSRAFSPLCTQPPGPRCGPSLNPGRIWGVSAEVARCISPARGPVTELTSSLHLTLPHLKKLGQRSDQMPQTIHSTFERALVTWRGRAGAHCHPVLFCSQDRTWWPCRAWKSRGEGRFCRCEVSGDACGTIPRSARAGFPTGIRARRSLPRDVERPVRTDQGRTGRRIPAHSPQTEPESHPHSRRSYWLPFPATRRHRHSTENIAASAAAQDLTAALCTGPNGFKINRCMMRTDVPSP